MPKRKMINLDSANTQQDSQNLLTGCLECERNIKTRATLLDKCKVKSSRVGDRLDALGPRSDWGRCHYHGRGGSVGVGCGNARLIHNLKGTLEDKVERTVRVLFAPVPSIPTKVHREVQEVCEAFIVFRCIDPCRSTAWQGSKRIKVDRLCALRLQVGVQEGCVTQFIIGIIANVL